MLDVAVDAAVSVMPYLVVQQPLTGLLYHIARKTRGEGLRQTASKRGCTSDTSGAVCRV